MHSSKSQILVALKRQGRCSVDELAIALHLAPMTVRQHLATLERDGLVVSAEERQRMGRPHFVFSLTEQGDESFGMRYDRIALQLLLEVGRLDSQEIAGLSAEEKTALLFDRLADRFISRYRPRMGPLTLADFIGLDVCLDIMRVLQDGLGDPKYRPCPLLIKMVDAGWLGKKSGRGFYKY